MIEYILPFLENYFKYTDITDVNFIKILNDLHIEVPRKKQVEFVFEKEERATEYIENAIREKGLKTVEEVGEATNAGTGCGGCQEQIQEILDEINGK